MQKMRNFVLAAVAALSLAACAVPGGFGEGSLRAANEAVGQEAEKQIAFSENEVGAVMSAGSFSLAQIPAYSGEPYVEVNGNVPYFSEEELTQEPFETYSELDYLGRCGAAYANVCLDLMPTEERGAIGQVKPSGWHLVKYDIVDGNYLYNRCHLIGYQLAGENANEKNLITGTRYLNVTGMLPFENMVSDYVEETGNHVLYRVTPEFEGANLLASGVRIEAKSVEDNGDGILFHVFVYNVQPGVTINYASGESMLGGAVYAGTGGGGGTSAGAAAQGQKDEEDAELSAWTEAETQAETDGQETDVSAADYILNTNSKKFHYPSCSSVEDIKEKNKKAFHGSREDVISMGYSPCKRCSP